ncbi:23 kDa integral membrane protein-like [Drosophila rhopaloa]|uniref:23 kDa integral membrane protein n=2 Tax=Drosophila rhopaloa TaxID=1041015 RepID=A0ABM5J0U6_DRORH|nr:23 kDa integral membrane protein-like [Drosophila rhopaloa]XP_044312448.1 23 kDa integral membrane protein-like [Drosophila rhopaloa]
MSCKTSTLKYSFFFSNTIWLIIGILVIVSGALSLGMVGYGYVIGILVVGVVIILTSLFGYYGAVREGPRMLWMYVSFLLALLVVVLTFIILHPKDIFKNYAIQEVKDHWKLEETHPGSMDTIQTSYQCCGLDGAADYLNSKVWNHTAPNSCCKENICVNPLNLNREGCLRNVELSFEDENSIVRYMEWGLFGFNIVMLVLGAILAIHYTNSQRRFNY